MSKSLGNVIAPQEVIDKYGAEILRLWVAAEDYRDDIRLSPDILKHLADAYRRFRNTCRFMLGNLYDFDPAAHWLQPDERAGTGPPGPVLAGPAAGAGSNGPTTITNSTWPSTACTSSAPWRSAPSTWTS